MKAIPVRNIRLGEGRPKICVPLTGETEEELRAEAARASASRCDLIEWRADCFRGLKNPGTLVSMLRVLREISGDMPILFTIRTDREGGTIAISSEDYLSCNLTAIESGFIDLVDAELSQGDAVFTAIVQAAHGAGSNSPKGVAVIGSRHDFEKTPPREELVTRLCQMQELGADIAKFAVMPRSERDVLTLLDATLAMKEDHDKTPVITMSMGKQGVISRIGGGVFGSCLTFGTAGNASAPGQIPADILADFLSQL